MIGIGIDFGTSNSAAAWYDGERVTLVRLEESGEIMPTATHLDRRLHPRTGAAAVTQYIEENRDRVVEMTPEVVGKGQLLVDEGNPENPNSEAEVVTENVYGQAVIDRGLPGRLFRGVKRLLANPSIKRLMVFEHPFRLVALITPVLLHIRRCLEAQIPEPIGDVHLGHPVRFEGQSGNKLGLERLGEACEHAGFNQLTFFPEPVAATLSFLRDDTAPREGKVLALDFGGGTLDLSVVEFHGVDFKVLATSGLSLGGDHVDQLIFRRLLFPLLGKGETWSRVRDGKLIENEFPFEEFEDKLLNWAVTYTLNQNHYRAKIADCIKQGGQAAEKFARLDDLITHNYSYIVFQEIKEAKAALSLEEETLLDIPELDISLTITRSQLETMMADMLKDIDDVLDLVVKDAGLSQDDIDFVIRTGGSSQIASVRRMLDQKFPGKVTQHDPFTSVAAGLAIASFHGYEFSDAKILTG